MKDLLLRLFCISSLLLTRPVLYRCVDPAWVWTRPFHFYYILSSFVHYFAFPSIRYTLCMLNILHSQWQILFELTSLARFTELSIVGVAEARLCWSRASECERSRTLAYPPLRCESPS
jgi:hypothetical protein